MDAVTFKKGDHVRCVIPAGVLRKGAIYVVEDVPSWNYLTVMGGDWFEWRFEPLPEITRPDGII